MKNMKMNSIALACLSLLSTNAFAGDKAGNGGVVFLCSDRVKLVDFWESEDLRNPMSIGDRNAPLAKLVDAYLSRLDFFDESRAQIARKFADTVLSDLDALARDSSADTELVRFTEGPLNFSLDSDEVSTPSGCEKAQAVTQKQPEIEGEKLLTIYRPIWDRMDNEMRAFTIFHEINIHSLIDLRLKQAQENHQAPAPLTSTRPARLLNQWIGSSRFAAQRTICDYRLAESRFGMMDPDLNTYGGFTLLSDKMESLKCDPTTHRIVSAPDAYRSIGTHGTPTAGIEIWSPVFDPNSTQWLSAKEGDYYSGSNAWIHNLERDFDSSAVRWDYIVFRDAVATPQADGSTLIKNIRRFRPWGGLVSVFHGGDKAKDRFIGTAELRVFTDGKFTYTRDTN